MVGQLIVWLAAAFATWGQPLPPEGPARDAIETARTEVAAEIVAVAYDPDETPLYPGVDGRPHTAALLAVIAQHESSLVKRIRDGKCRPDECDHGAAVGLMQIQAGRWGLMLDGSGYKHCDRADSMRGVCYTAADLAREEGTAIRFALHILRKDKLSGYTGAGDPSAPIVRRRESLASGWLRAHPAPSAEPMELARE